MARNSPYQRARMGLSVPKIDFAASKATARGFANLTQSLDRMTSQIMDREKIKAKAAGEEYGAENAPTKQQVLDAIKNDTSLDLVGDKGGSVFERSAYASALDVLSTELSLYAKQAITSVTADALTNESRPEVLAAEIKAITNSISKTLRENDPEVARKVNAQLGIYGNTQYNSYSKQFIKTEKERTVATNIAAYNSVIDDVLPAVIGNSTSDETIKTFGLQDAATTTEKVAMLRSNLINIINAPESDLSSRERQKIVTDFDNKVKSETVATLGIALDLSDNPVELYQNLEKLYQGKKVLVMDDQARAAFELMPTEDKARFFENMKTEMPGMVKARIKFLSNKDEVFMSIDAKDNMYGGPLMQNYLIEDLLYKDSYTGPNEEIGKLFNMLSQQDRNALGIEFQNDMARKTNEKIQRENYLIAEDTRRTNEILKDGAEQLNNAINSGDLEEVNNIRKELLEQMPLKSDKINKLIDSLNEGQDIIESDFNAIKELENGYLYFTLTKEDVWEMDDITNPDKLEYYKKFSAQESNDHWQYKSLYRTAVSNVAFIPSKDTGPEANFRAQLGMTSKEREGAVRRKHLLKQTTALLVDGEKNLPYGISGVNPEDIATIILDEKAVSDAFVTPEHLVKVLNPGLVAEREKFLNKEVTRKALSPEEIDRKPILEAQYEELLQNARIKMAQGMLDGNGNLITPQSIINKLKEHPRFGQKYTDMIDGN